MTAARYGRRLLAGLGVLILGVGVAWWWWPVRGPTPPLPADVREEDVRELIDLARHDVLARRNSGQAWGYLGKVLLAHLFDREAGVCFTEAARLEPSEPIWLYAQALIALKRDPENGLNLLRAAEGRATRGSPPHTAIALRLAEALLERRLLDEAEEVLARVRGGGARWEDARTDFGLALLARARGRSRQAEELFIRAQASPFARKAALVQLAALARANGDDAWSEAYQSKATALSGDPPWPDPLLDEVVSLQVGRRGRERRIDRLENERRFAKAAEVYLEQIDREPQPRDYVGAGVNLARVRDFERALPLLRQGVKLDPDGAQARYSLGLVLFTRAEIELARSPGSAEAQAWLREAIEHARRATEVKPDHAHAYGIWGLALLALKDPAAAVAPLRRGVECEPSHFNLQWSLGQALSECGQRKEAEAHLEAARQLNPDDPRPGQALERLRRKEPGKGPPQP